MLASSLEGRHHLLSQKPQTPVHGFLGEEPTGIQLRGDPRDPQHFLKLGQAVDDALRAAKDHSGLQEFLIAGVDQPLVACLPHLSPFGPGAPPRILKELAHAAEEGLIDVAGLCVAARNTDYVRAALAGWEANGACTAIGHARTLDAAGAAFVNGTAAHGEDFDDTFEGGPVHAGAVIVPTVLAIGDTATMPARFAQSSGGQWTQYLVSNFGVRMTITTEDSLVVPGESALTLRYAKAVKPR
jgi:hypothetical protein